MSLVPGVEPTGNVHEVVAPFDLSPIGKIDSADAQIVEVAVANADRLYRDKSSWLPTWERIAILEKAAELLTERAEEFALESAREGGKPLMDSKVEVARAIDGIKNCIEVLRTQHGEEIPMGLNTSSANRLAFTSHEPIGPVLAYSAFNHPTNLIIHQVFPAVAVGCPVIVKPAADTPLSCFRLVELLHEAGLPPEWCQAVVIKDRSLATNLVGDNRFGFFSFIGSGEVGWMLRSKLAPGTRCALEHGGVAPVIVSHDADLDQAVPALTKAGFYHGGQVCVSAQRFYIHEKIFDPFKDRIVKEAGKIKTGDPTLAETGSGPLIRPKECDRVEQWVDQARQAGATIACGGKKISATCYEPTVVVSPPEDSQLSQEEVFGPVICLYPYSELSDAIRRANQLPVSFQAAVYSSNMDTIMQCYRGLNGSAIMANDHTAFRVDWMPFAGLKVSGHGTGGIPHTMRDMQIEKMLVLKSNSI
ncbi:MAG: aldehyde dehydrogenase family protein [Verrucomicrobiota bacterium]